MPTTRSYGDACGIARALDVVGERWALLIVRELLFGPQRFSDIQGALPRASSNLLSDRLHELQDNGVIERRQQAPPSGAWVYELTDAGRRLKPIVMALGEWGTQFPVPSEPIALSPGATLLNLESTVRLGAGAPALNCRIVLDGRAWTILSEGTQIVIKPGAEPGTEDVTLSTDPTTLSVLLDDPDSLEARVSDRQVVVEGDRAALERLLRAGSAQPR